MSLEAGRPIVPVGTTSVRVLETLYWIGARSLLEDAPPSPTTTTVGQWEPFHVRVCEGATCGAPGGPQPRLEACGPRIGGWRGGGGGGGAGAALFDAPPAAHPTWHH